MDNTSTPQKRAFDAPATHSAPADPKFPWVLFGHVAVVVILFGLLVKEPSDDAASQAQVDTTYTFFQHVSIMIFIGFGFLMTFLYRYSFSAVGLNLMLSCFVYLWNIVAATFWEEVHSGKTLHRQAASLPIMVEGLFGAGAVMISFGAVLGRTLPSQLVFMAFWEIVFYSLNFYLGALELKAADAGGSMFIHLFGALFGLAAASQLTPPKAGRVDHPYNGSRYTSDVTAMIGTIFLFIFWPSFNGGLTTGSGQLRAVFNTTLCLAGSVLAAFGMSHLLSGGKFDMVHIQNATIAGGVAMGTSANLALNPALSVCLGFVTGSVSVIGYVHFTPRVRAKFNIEDTCGVLNLHGVPGVIGAVFGLFAILLLNESSYPTSLSGILREMDRDEGDQALAQLWTLLITIAISIVGGVATGFCTKFFWRSPAWPQQMYSDFGTWEVPDDYTQVGAAGTVAPSDQAFAATRDINYSVVVSPAAKVLPHTQAQPAVAAGNDTNAV